jgi:hypothetical protein
LISYLTIVRLGAITVLLPFVALLLNVHRLWKYNKWLFLFITNHFISEVVTLSLASFKIRNLEAIVLFSSIEGILLILIYYNQVKLSIFRKILLCSFPLYLIGGGFVYFFMDLQLSVSSYAYSFQHALLLVPVIFYFVERIILVDDLYITQSPLFWISAGFLFFYSASILYFGLRDYLFHFYPEWERKGLWLHTVALVAMNILLTKGIWQVRKA